jgi:hypothetical protein
VVAMEVTIAAVIRNLKSSLFSGQKSARTLQET